MSRIKYLVLGVLVVAVIVLIALHPWSALFALGVHPYPAGTPWTYQLWSGFVPALAIASLIGSLVTVVRNGNCHVHGCWRLGRYPMAGGQFKVCARHSHHPDKITHDYILEKHREHECATSQRES